MSTKKKPTKKTTTAKKSPAKKQTKSKAKAKPAKKTAAKIPAADLDMRRPPSNPVVPPLKIGQLAEDLSKIKTTLEGYAAHLRSLDRMRLNGVGIKKQGFIQRAYNFAIENPEFLPHYLTLQKFHNDDVYFQSFRMMVDDADQIRELLWNITIEASDIIYTDGLEYYASVREAAKRRVDAAETIHAGLSVFFKSRKNRGEEPTEKELERDMRSLIRGKKDGKIVIENVKPKLAGGTHKVLDEKFSGNAQYKETDENEIKE